MTVRLAVEVESNSFPIADPTLGENAFGILAYPPSTRNLQAFLDDKTLPSVSPEPTGKPASMACR